VGCNNWQALDSGEWRHLSDDDITALKGMVTRWTKRGNKQGCSDEEAKAGAPQHHSCSLMTDAMRLRNENPTRFLD
jgi:hypothetical protein